MHRRTYLAAASTAGLAATAGCSTVSGERTLTDPTVRADSSGRKALIFASNGEEVGHLGVDGGVAGDRIDLSTEIWHRQGTSVESVELRLWMPETATDSASEVGVVSPVQGDSSPPPSLALYAPEQALGTVVELTDLDDLADETISTLDLVVEPGSATATKLTVDATIELAGGGILSTDYTLDGRLQLTYPELDTH